MVAKKPILLAGPTASGKSALAMALADRLDGVVVNADALQVYDHWRVLTARPSAADEALVPHRLYGHVPAARAYSVGAWLTDVRRTMAEAGGRQVIVVGGTGLYFSALCDGLAEIPPVPAAVRERGDAMRQEGGVAAFAAVLAAQDPRTWARIDQANPARAQRAWEVLTATGTGLSAWQDRTGPPALALADAVPVCLEAPRDWLVARIEKRFDAMVDAGALDECRAWLKTGLPLDSPAGRALGARDLCAYLAGEISRAEAVARATVATRQFAKRQRSWFRARMPGWQRIDIAQQVLGDAVDAVTALTPR